MLFLHVLRVKQGLNCNGISPSLRAGRNYREFFVVESKQGTVVMAFTVLENSAKRLNSFFYTIEVRGNFFFCLCESIKAQLTGWHSVALVTGACSETAAQLEPRVMEEYVNS